MIFTPNKIDFTFLGLPVTGLFPENVFKFVLKKGFRTGVPIKDV